jgi:phenylacetate-CoA ligase
MRPSPVDTRVPRSAVAGIAWPAIVPDDAALLLALQQQFDETQWWTPQALLDAQLTQLGRLLQHASAAVPWQAARLRACGYAAGAPLSIDEVRRLPITTRRDVQANFQAMVSRQPIADHGSGRDQYTSGSTGTPVRVRSNDLKQVYWHAVTLRDHLWHRRKLEGKFAAIRIAGEEGTHPSWGVAAGTVFGTGPGVQLGVHADLEAQCRWLVAERPDYLLSYPSNLSALARHARERGFDLSFLSSVLTFGEALPDGLRDELRAAWRVELTDVYSAQEPGYIALQCPEAHCYHVQSECVLVEVLDDAGAPCRPGETGRVVITDLHNFEMPLVRYEIGDYATVGQPCRCGRGLPVLDAIAGRVRNMLLLPDGRRRFPRIGARSLASIACVRQYQFAQVAPTRIEVRLVSERPLDAQEEAHLRGVVQDRLGHPYDVRLRYCSEIPRAASGKFEDFRCEIDVP